KNLNNFRRKGIVSFDDSIKEKKKEILLKAYKKNGDLKVIGNGKLSDLMKYFDENDILLHKDISSKGISTANLKKALSAGFINEISIMKKHVASLLLENAPPANPISLNEEQTFCSNEILKSSQNNVWKTFLIHGITGSGKTMVYISVVAEILKIGKTALILVPEISLTPQTVRKFRSYFGDRIAVLHSKMSDFERYESWKNIKKGVHSIVIGPRSAIFAPLQNPGVIIVDEEHDSSYKQTDSAPRYCARNSAIMRGFLNTAPVILGSATPSMESYYNAVSGKYRLLEIKNRFSSAVLPDIKVVKKENPNKLFEENVLRLFEKELALGRKIMVLQNRRGYSPHLLCKSCGNTATCPNCSVSLTYHLSQNQLICHYCGYFENGKNYCPKCGDTNIYFKGIGTEQVEMELKKVFPEIPVFRMDYDTTRNKDGHRDILDKFEKSGASILVGTQMISKGLDFHTVSVVCIVNVDGELIFPDFRSDEKAFQLMEQVSGRAGRGKIKGKVILQSFNENNSIIKHVMDHDYLGFIKDEMKIRELTSYPPFSKIIKLTLSSKDLSEVRTKSMELYENLVRNNKDCIIYKPVDKMVLKVNNIFRLYILIKSLIIQDRNGKKSRELVSCALETFKSSSKIKIDVDVDPSDLM
ncbi:MAG: primosomal protein N', partial [Candidatus Delongbacteria bacterium]|nr:primosomal protein N' [Candidatus Delongbacteria bacterium]